MPHFMSIWYLNVKSEKLTYFIYNITSAYQLSTIGVTCDKKWVVIISNVYGRVAFASTEIQPPALIVTTSGMVEAGRFYLNCLTVPLILINISGNDVEQSSIVSKVEPQWLHDTQIQICKDT